MMKIRRLLALVKKDMKMTTREPALLFLLLLFPLMITIVFGVAFGGINSGGDTHFEFGVVNLDNSTDSTEWSDYFIGNLTEMNGTVVFHYQDNETGQNDLLNGHLDALIVIPDGFGASIDSYWNSPLNSTEWANTTLGLYLDSSSMVGSSAIPPMVQQNLLKTIYGETATTLELPIEISSPSMVKVSNMTMWDYMAPGIFAFSAIFMIMTVSQSMTTERDEGLLRRMATTPVSSSEFIVSKALSHVIIAILQVTIIFAVSFLIGYSPATGIDGLLFAFLIVIIFALACVGFGLITAVISKSAEVATGLSFVFIMPMMFFGTFMNLGGVGETLGTFMPSNYVTHALRTLFLRGAPVTSILIWIDLLVVAVVTVVVLGMGILLFEKRGRK
ncbi:MAG: ABC transporter permease subunit [Candidatus Lokiarchaeota archaeon]|nr:ABC transporter permease subunit [Candidatus Lokiarchaeota archaeon]